MKPAAPSNLSAQAASCSQINLEWNDNSGNEEGYKIYRNGSYVGQVGMNVKSYQDTGLSENTTYSYYVRAFRGSIQSDSSNTATAHTPECPPADTEPPVVNWLAPVSNEQVYTVGSEVIQLKVSATDNVAVDRVWFYRWDAVNEQCVDIGTDYTAPYQMSLDCSTLNYGWNHVFAEAYDTTGNPSEGKWILLYRRLPAPDLHPHSPDGYPYPVVPSSIQGTHEVDTLYAGVPTYFDWHFINSGDATASGDFHVELWVGGTRYIRYPFSNWGSGWVNGFDDWNITIPTSGWHTVQLITDPDDTIAESDETNNIWEQLFYWETTCDDACELNNDPSQATELAYGETKSAYICPAGDEDFFQFTGQSGDQIVIDIDARVNGSTLDPYIYLLDSDGTRVLAQNDDEPTNFDSKLGYSLPHDGTYYVKVREFSHPNEGGSDYFYTIHLLTDDADPSPVEITSPRQ